MKVIYTDYSESAILDRNIDKDVIKDAISNPDELLEGKKGRKIAHKIVGDRLLRVMYEVDAKAYNSNYCLFY